MTRRTAEEVVKDYREELVKRYIYEYAEAGTAAEADEAVRNLMDLNWKDADGDMAICDEPQEGDYVMVAYGGSIHEGVVESFDVNDIAWVIQISFEGGVSLLAPYGATILLLAPAQPELPTEVGTIIRATRIKGQKRDLPLALAETGPYPFVTSTQWQGMNGKGAFTAWVDGNDIEEWEVLFTPSQVWA